MRKNTWNTEQLHIHWTPSILLTRWSKRLGDDWTGESDRSGVAFKTFLKSTCWQSIYCLCMEWRVNLLDDSWMQALRMQHRNYLLPLQATWGSPRTFTRRCWALRKRKAERVRKNIETHAQCLRQTGDRQGERSDSVVHNWRYSIKTRACLSLPSEDGCNN